LFTKKRKIFCGPGDSDMIIDAMVGYILEESIVETGIVIAAANYEGIQPNKSLLRELGVSSLFVFPAHPLPCTFYLC
jgi:hypothetical protein